MTQAKHAKDAVAQEKTKIKTRSILQSVQGGMRTS